MNKNKKLYGTSIQSLVDYYRVLREAEGLKENTLLACLNPQLESKIQQKYFTFQIFHDT